MVEALRQYVDGLTISPFFEKQYPGRTGELLGSHDPSGWLRLLAEVGAFHGSEEGGDVWARWLALGRALGRPLADELETLSDQELRSLGGAGVFCGGDRAVGLAAYRAFVRAKPKKYGPFAGENTEYLLALFEEGRGAEVAEEHRLIHDEVGRTPEEDLVFLAEQARSGDADARANLEKIARDIDRPSDQQALAAYLLEAIEPSRSWGEIIARVLGEETIWKIYRAQFRRVPEAYGIPVPEKAKDAPPPKGQQAGTPSYLVESGDDLEIYFGGRDWEVPKCAGCGHDTFVWFTLHPKKIPELAQWLPWDVAPLLACADCGNWMGKNRYEVDISKRRITLLESELAGDKKLSHPFSETKRPARQTAKLRKLTAGAWKKIFDKSEPTVVAGKPPRLADYSWPRCRGCKQWMRYYGALGTNREFAGMAPIANDGGYLLHFACVPCARITVVPNWS